MCTHSSWVTFEVGMKRRLRQSVFWLMKRFCSRSHKENDRTDTSKCFSQFENFPCVFAAECNPLTICASAQRVEQPGVLGSFPGVTEQIRYHPFQSGKNLTKRAFEQNPVILFDLNHFTTSLTVDQMIPFARAVGLEVEVSSYGLLEDMLFKANVVQSAAVCPPNGGQSLFLSQDASTFLKSVTSDLSCSLLIITELSVQPHADGRFSAAVTVRGHLGSYGPSVIPTTGTAIEQTEIEGSMTLGKLRAKLVSQTKKMENMTFVATVLVGETQFPKIPCEIYSVFTVGCVNKSSTWIWVRWRSWNNVYHVSTICCCIRSFASNFSRECSRTWFSCLVRWKVSRRKKCLYGLWRSRTWL